MKQEEDTEPLHNKIVDLDHLGCSIPLTQVGAKTFSFFGTNLLQSCILYECLPPKHLSCPSLLSNEKPLAALSSCPLVPRGAHGWVPGDQTNSLQSVWPGVCAAQELHPVVFLGNSSGDQPTGQGWPSCHSHLPAWTPRAWTPRCTACA